MTNVTRLPIDPGPAGWNELLPKPDTTKELRAEITADFLVIGAGFAGLAAASRLSQMQPDARIVVLEARRVGEGPAGRNSGFMIDLPHDLSSDNYGGDLSFDLVQIEDNRRGIEFAAGMARDFTMPAEAFVKSGKINGAATEKGHAHNLDFAQHIAALNEPYSMLDAVQMKEMTGTTYYKSGLFTPGAAMVQPALFVRSAAMGLITDGVSLFEGSPVMSLKRKGDWIATTPTGRVTAPTVILAVNGHLESFGYMKGRLAHIFTYASMSRALSGDEVALLGGADEWGVTPADPMGTTVRRICGTGGHRLVVRNRFTFDPSMEVNQRRIASVGKDHDKAFAARFPMLRNVEMQYRWGGRLCLSMNNVQVIKELDDGLWSACCQNGLGTAKGTLAGVLAAEASLGVDSPSLRRALSSDQPKRLPPRPIAQIGAAIRMKWGEAKAGREL
jgi:glycine/D-amino acid oxidase-like deaminating enzyme